MTADSRALSSNTEKLPELSTRATSLLLNYGLAAAANSDALSEVFGELKAFVARLEETALTRDEALFLDNLYLPTIDQLPFGERPLVANLRAKLRSRISEGAR